MKWIDSAVNAQIQDSSPPQQEDCCSNISTTQYSLTIVSILDQNWFRALHFHRILSGSRVYLSDSLTWKGFVPRFNIDSTSISPVMKFECLQERNRFGWNVQFPLFWIPQLGWTATHGFPMNFLFASLNCLLQLTQIYWDMHLKNLWMNIRILNRYEFIFWTQLWTVNVENIAIMLMLSRITLNRRVTMNVRIGDLNCQTYS